MLFSSRFLTFRTQTLRRFVWLACGGLSACVNYAGITPEVHVRSTQSLDLPASEIHARAVSTWGKEADIWHLYEDDQLNEIVTSALRDNPTLYITEARLKKAEALMESAGANRLPRTQLDANATHQLYSERGLAPSPFAGTVHDSGLTQLSFNWNLDFFGKYRSALAAAVGEQQAALAETQAARVALISQVLKNYVRFAQLGAQLKIAEALLEERSAVVSIIQSRVNAGLDTLLEQRQSEGTVPEMRGQILILKEQLNLQRHTLAALAGEPRLAERLHVPSLTSKPLLLDPTKMNADLLGQRADIVAARWRVEAALQSSESARADFYPNVNIMTFLGFSSIISLGTVFQNGSRQWGVAPALSLPIFDAGRLRAQLKVKNAELDIAVLSYNQALLQGIKEIADALVLWQSVQQQEAEAERVAAVVNDAYNIAKQRYAAGLNTKLQILNAENSVLQQQRIQHDLAARALDAQIELWRASGGGYREIVASNQPSSTTLAFPDSIAPTH